MVKSAMVFWGSIFYYGKQEWSTIVVYHCRFTMVLQWSRIHRRALSARTIDGGHHVYWALSALVTHSWTKAHWIALMTVNVKLHHQPAYLSDHAIRLVRLPVTYVLLIQLTLDSGNQEEDSWKSLQGSYTAYMERSASSNSVCQHHGQLQGSPEEAPVPHLACDQSPKDLRHLWLAVRTNLMKQSFCG